MRESLVALGLRSDPASNKISSSDENRRPTRIGVVDFGLDSELRIALADKAEFLTDPIQANARDYSAVLVPAGSIKNPLWSNFISQAVEEAYVPAGSALGYERGAKGRAWLGEGRLRQLLEPGRQNSSTYISFRSIVEKVISLVALTLLLPLFGVVALLILATMGRPVLFAQERVGQNGRMFTMYKFRTMLMSCYANDTATAENDKRITRIGRLLRRTHIDELPQLWNILIGDMSIIGPRPEQPSLVTRYRSNIPEFDLRHAIKPGLTGWAQVRFGYAANESETRQKLEYDLYYVRHRGLFLDLKIILLTFLVLFDARYVR